MTKREKYKENKGALEGQNIACTCMRTVAVLNKTSQNSSRDLAVSRSSRDTSSLVFAALGAVDPPGTKLTSLSLKR